MILNEIGTQKVPFRECCQSTEATPGSNPLIYDSKMLDRTNVPKNGEAEEKVAHTCAPDPSHFCPNCSVRLVDHRCKLKCPQCGYFLSCSDFY